MFKKLYKNILLSVILGLLVVLIPKQALGASLIFDPKSSSVSVGDTISVDVVVDSGAVQISSTDVYILYDSAAVSLQSVTGGQFFPLVNNVPARDKIYVYGAISTPGEFKTGSGIVATLVFKAEAEGVTNLEIFCDLTATETSKVIRNDINASNIINCSASEKHAVTVSAGTNLTPTPTRTAQTLPDAGFLDPAITYSVFGGLMLIFGAVVRMFLLKG